MAKRKLRFDEIGYWSEVKLDIVRDYAKAYSRNLSAQQTPSFHHVYIDGFAGPGVNISKATGTYVPGSPLNALLVDPPFREFYLIDMDQEKVETLKGVVGNRRDVHILAGDCNDILIKRVFPKVRYEDYRRALCLLDPYGVDLNWEVMESAGQMRSIDMFLNFPVMGINRNALWRRQDLVTAAAIERMNRFWGDESWRTISFRRSRGLFEEIEEKESNKVVAEAFRQRLREVAGFQRVLDPVPMCNSKGAVVYYLFFATQKLVAEKIVQHIFRKYRERAQ